MLNRKSAICLVGIAAVVVVGWAVVSLGSDGYAPSDAVRQLDKLVDLRGVWTGIDVPVENPEMRQADAGGPLLELGPLRVQVPRLITRLKFSSSAGHVEGEKQIHMLALEIEGGFRYTIFCDPSAPLTYVLTEGRDGFAETLVGVLVAGGAERSDALSAVDLAITVLARLNPRQLLQRVLSASRDDFLQADKLSEAAEVAALLMIKETRTLKTVERFNVGNVHVFLMGSSSGRSGTLQVFDEGGHLLLDGVFDTKQKGKMAEMVNTTGILLKSIDWDHLMHWYGLGNLEGDPVAPEAGP